MPSEIKLDLHDVYNRGGQIEAALEAAFAEARRIRARSLQIIPGKGSGQLKKRVHRFLQQPECRQVIRNIDNDSRNWGRLFVYFSWEK